MKLKTLFESDGWASLGIDPTGLPTWEKPPHKIKNPTTDEIYMQFKPLIKKIVMNTIQPDIKDIEDQNVIIMVMTMVWETIIEDLKSGIIDLDNLKAVKQHIINVATSMSQDLLR